MKSLAQVQIQLSTGEFNFSRHALRRLVERNISELEIMQAGLRSEIIEEYPDDKYSPSCLLLGFTQARRALHIQISLADTRLLKIITLYEPDEEEWVNYSERR
jgi:hypothetical protein